jgi:hypothetical protein
MSTSITIHGIDDSTVHWIHNEAEKQGVEEETVILSIIHKAISQKTDDIADLPEYHDLDHLAGTWTKEETEEFLKNIAEFEHIDPNLWR